MSDFSAHSTAARLALSRAEQEALLGHYDDACVLLDTVIREIKAFRIIAIGKRQAIERARERLIAANVLPEKR